MGDTSTSPNTYDLLHFGQPPCFRFYQHTYNNLWFFPYWHERVPTSNIWYTQISTHHEYANHSYMLLIRHQGLCGHGWYLYIPTYIWFIRHLESLHIAKFTNATTKGFDFFSRWHVANLTNTARIVFGFFSYWHGRPPPVLHPWILTHHEYANHSYDATYLTSRSLRSWVIPLHPNTHMIH